MSSVNADSLITPRACTSKHEIVYRKSNWCIHQFKILSGGEPICTVAVLKMHGSLLFWIGAAADSAAECLLDDVAIGVPARGGGAALATTLLGEEGAPAAMARRLAALLQCPVYFCSGSLFNRFSLPLVEKGIIAEIKSRPECF